MPPARRRAPFFSIALACVLLTPVVCAAQRTGGSFGSSSSRWGGSSSRGEGSSGSGSGFSPREEQHESWRGSSDERSSSRQHEERSPLRGDETSSGGADPYEPALPALPSYDEVWRSARIDRGRPPLTERERAAVQPAVPLWAHYAGVVAILFALTWVPTGIGAAWKRRRPRREASAQLRRLSVGFDWTIREQLQRRLSELASALSIETDRERARAAREVMQLLRDHVSAACYAYLSATRVTGSEAPGELARIAIDLRARFAQETRGRGSGPVPELVARPEEGAGMLVVTLVIGSTSDARELAGASDRRSLRALLASFVTEPELQGLEVIWSPAEDADRMSSYELERFYPELVRLSDADAAGSVRCAHCAAPRPRELDRCPQCGASAIA